MSDSKNLSAEILGRINVLQSMVTLMPNMTSMLEFTCQGLKDVAGVKSLTYQLFQGNASLQIKNVFSTDTKRVFPIKSKTTAYAELFFEISENTSFEPYIPFLKNFVNMLGVIFEEHTQRKMNEELLEELEQRVVERTRELQEKKEDLRITLNSIGDAVISTDILGNVTSMNPVAEKLTGWKTIDGIGEKITDVFSIINPHTTQPVLNPVSKVLATGEIVSLANHTTLISKNGNHYQIADSAAPICDIKGIISGVVLVFRDVTEEYRIAEALKVSEEKYRNIVEETSDLVTGVDNKGEIIFVNRCAEKIFGLSVTQCLGKSAFEFVHPEDREKTEHWFGDCINKQVERSSFENSVIHQVTKEIFQLLWTCNFHYDDKGCLQLVNSVAHDITKRKQVEDALRKSKEQLRTINYELEQRVEQRTLELQETQKQVLHVEKLSEIGKLSASIAHEVNNPLQGIMSILKGLKKKAILEAEDRELLDAAIGASDRIKNLIRSLQDFNRPSSGKQSIMDVHKALDSILLLNKSDFNGKRISVVRNFAEELPQIRAVSDQIKQVFLNLLTNAADACLMRGGVITVSTYQVNDMVAVAIKDTGIGIKPEQMKHIYRPFYTTKAAVKGTGLGLSISYGIIKKHHGEIRVESQPGEGATFTVLLPIKGAEETVSATDM